MRARRNTMVRWRLSMLGLCLAAWGVCRFYLQYPSQLSLLTAFALVALAYSARRTYYEQRRLYRTEPSWEFDADGGEDPESDPASDSSSATRPSPDQAP